MKTKLILTAALLIAVFSGCKKEKYLAASFGVSNTTETVYTTAARLEATFSYPGTKYVIRVDVSERQDMSEAVHYDVKVNGDKLTAYVTGLKANTTYYYRYSNDTGFGILSSEQKSFKTNDYSVPAVTTAEVSEITESSAKCGGNVISDGGFAVTARGVCWGTSQNPTVSNSHTTDGSGTGSFTSSITGLTANTTYYVRAYATNSKGTSYGEQKSFTTPKPKFSVRENTTVEFAPGNLYWDGSAFRFEADQWSFADTWNENHVSHFKWSDAANAVTAYNYSGDLFCASNFTVTGDSHTWRTLSKDEWNYLLNSRTNAPSLRAWKELDGGTHKGLVILPDGTDASVMDSITSTDALASHGAVFLPAAGYRDGTVVYYVGSYGRYWSSTPYEVYEDLAYYMFFYSGIVGTLDDPRNLGYAVRLVR